MKKLIMILSCLAFFGCSCPLKVGDNVIALDRGENTILVGTVIEITGNIVIFKGCDGHTYAVTMNRVAKTTKNFCEE